MSVTTLLLPPDRYASVVSPCNEEEAGLPLWPSNDLREAELGVVLAGCSAMYDRISVNGAAGFDRPELCHAACRSHIPV